MFWRFLKVNFHKQENHRIKYGHHRMLTLLAYLKYFDEFCIKVVHTMV